jgi:catechol 2,3-dioxygenase-like lactoylglutathione lyase family enzyme
MGEAARVTACLMRVFDLDRSVNFYRDVFECHVAVHEPEAALLLTPGGFQIYFRAHEALGTRGIDDVGVEQIMWSAGSEAELQRIERRLRTHDPSTYTNTQNGVICVDGVDPDGNRILITYPTPEQLPREVIDRRLR